MGLIDDNKTAYLEFGDHPKKSGLDLVNLNQFENISPIPPKSLFVWTTLKIDFIQQQKMVNGTIVHNFAFVSTCVYVIILRLKHFVSDCNIDNKKGVLNAL